MEAFSDGVMAIIITIMVLGLTPPHEARWVALLPQIPVFLSYALSFVFLGIYWNNHHHLWQVVEQVNGAVLWTNLHLLFWLSLVPFATAWVGESGFAAAPVAIYGLVLLGAGGAYYLMTRVLLALHGGDTLLARALGSDFKGRISLWLYAGAVAVAWFEPWVACAAYVAVAIMWIVPDRRIERLLPSRRD